MIVSETQDQIDTTLYNVVVVDYTLQNNNGVRVGQLRFATDNGASTAILEITIQNSPNRHYIQ